ncbi:MAG: glycosyltransferase family 2 protein [Caulobacteraceae bacterium]|nr:glycosyltransferase family 2 protein [Caulobacteraceae bacterium]
MSNPKLTIGMATYDDAQGVWWTLASLRAHHVDPHDDDVELLVIDDMPGGCEETRRVCALSSARYVRHSKNLGPAHAKNTIWEHARGEYVLMLDCHVLLVPDHIEYLLAGIEQDRVGSDMWVGPLRNESGAIIATELAPRIRGDFFGTWHVQASTELVRPVHAHGSAYAFMRRSRWPGFSNHFRGFAGEEIYIHDKVRQQGGSVIYHTALGWVHRFARFGAVPYKLTLNDKCRNYLIAAYECGWNVEQFATYFAKRLPPDQMTSIVYDVEGIYPGIMTAHPSGPRFEALD